MKMKISKKLLALTMGLAILGTPIIAKAATYPDQGANTFFGGSNTYADAWSGWYGKNCYLSASLGNQSYERWKQDWNQTKLQCPGEHNVYATHDYQ